MESIIFDKLREKGLKNNIDIFAVDSDCSKCIIHYFDGEMDFERHKLKEKTLEVNAWASLDEVITKIKLQNTKKPPLGLTPHFIWIEQRIEDIIKAMDRYREADKEIPKKWYFELAHLETEKNKTSNNHTLPLHGAY